MTPLTGEGSGKVYMQKKKKKKKKIGYNLSSCFIWEGQLTVIVSSQISLCQIQVH